MCATALSYVLLRRSLPHVESGMSRTATTSRSIAPRTRRWWFESVSYTVRHAPPTVSCTSTRKLLRTVRGNVNEVFE